MGCDLGYLPHLQNPLSFNPRTRVGCDANQAQDYYMSHLFQSTHPRGVRPQKTKELKAYKERFNPRTRVGCDVESGQTGSVVHVSIHAPAWGATCQYIISDSHCQVSIHAPAWGATPKRRVAGKSVICFNPRTRVGCDRRLRGLIGMSSAVSIHAPAWGATARAVAGSG